MIHLLAMLLYRTCGWCLAHATNDPENCLLRQTVLGPFLLDRGPSSDRHERGASIPTWNFNSRRRGLSKLDRFAGTDGRWDAQLQWPTGAVGMVSPTNLGCRPSEQTGRPAASRKISLSRGVSAVLDNGRLHKNRLGCNERSNCSFNYRALPCPNIEPRTYFKGNTACRFSMTTCRHVAIPYHFRFGCSNRRLL